MFSGRFASLLVVIVVTVVVDTVVVEHEAAMFDKGVIDDGKISTYKINIPKAIPSKFYHLYELLYIYLCIDI